MNEALKTALQEARTAAEAALAAAQAGDYTEARRQLALLDTLREDCGGGNAAAGARRAKTLRLEAEATALLDDAQPEEAAETETEEPMAPVEPELPTAPAAQPGDATVAAEPVTLPPAAEMAAQPAAQRNVAAPHTYADDQWALVAAGLQASGEEADAREREAEAFEAQRVQAKASKDSFRAKVFEGQALQARVEVAALRGHYAAANAAWDRLFDVVTAIRSLEGGHRRKNGGVADSVKQADYEAAREGRLKISQWSQGKGLSAT